MPDELSAEQKKQQDKEYMQKVREAAPAFLRQGLGLLKSNTATKDGRNIWRQDVQRAFIEFSRDKGRMPTVEEFNVAVPGYFDPKPYQEEKKGGEQPPASAPAQSLAVSIQDGNVIVQPGSVLGRMPACFATGPAAFGAGSMDLYAVVNVTLPTDGSIGGVGDANISSVDISTSGATSSTRFCRLFGRVYVPSGETELVPGNFAFGPINGTVFRNWYSNPASVRIAWT